jgi:hypothetical protein
MAQVKSLKAMETLKALEESLLTASALLAEVVTTSIAAAKERGVSTYVTNREIAHLWGVGSHIGNAILTTKTFHDNAAKVAEKSGIDMTTLEGPGQDKDNP